MGTRNLTCVVFEGKIQVAQYGQWDGYPSGQGVGIIDIMRVPENRKWLEEGLEYIEMADFSNLVEGTPAYAAVTAYDNACPSYYVKDGQWTTRGDMGWFGLSDEKVTEEDWYRHFAEMVDGLRDDQWVTIIDCHI